MITATNYKTKIQRLVAGSTAVLMLAASFGFFSFGGQATAASGDPFAQAFLRLNTLNATQPTGGRVCVKPSTSNAAQTIASIRVTFPTTAGTDYTVNATAANWTVTTTGLDSGQTAMPTIGTASNVTGKTVTFPLGTPQALSNANIYCFNFSGTNTLTNSSAGAAETSQGQIQSWTSTTMQDRTIYSLSIISNNQVTTSATVPPSFQFTLSANTDNFGASLIPGNVVSTTGVTVGVITNAATGYSVWAQDANDKGASGRGALSSTVANYMIGGAAAVSGTPRTLTGEDYGLGVTVATGAGTVAPGYVGTGSQIGTLSPSSVGFAPIASATAPTNGDSFLCVLRARSTATTPAASDYTDTITYVGAGKF